MQAADASTGRISQPHINARRKLGRAAAITFVIDLRFISDLLPSVPSWLCTCATVPELTEYGPKRLDCFVNFFLAHDERWDEPQRL